MQKISHMAPWSPALKFFTKPNEVMALTVPKINPNIEQKQYRQKKHIYRVYKKMWFELIFEFLILGMVFLGVKIILRTLGTKKYKVA